jgi:tol-pal system protein YbgF
MTTGRSRLLASLALAAGWGLLVVFSFPGCSLNREYVRRGAVLDSAAARIYRLEQAQVRQGDELQLLRAQLLTELEGIGGQLDQVTAQLEDLTGRLDRPARRVPPAPDTVAGTAARPDTSTRQAGGVDPDKLYSTAYLDFTRGRYDLAISSFRRFIELFPDSDNADNAQYWVGESFYSLGQLDSAEAELRVVIAGYPEGNKVPSALYKLALLYQQTGRENAARSQLDRIVRDFPGSNEAKLAAERLRTLGNR